MSKKAKKKPSRSLSIIGLVLCFVFGFMLICNITIIVKGTLNPEQPPSVFSVTPLVVMSGSMSGDAPDHIEVGDLIFVGKAEPEELQVGDVIAYFQSKNSLTVITHRIIEVQTAEDGGIQWITKGDFNNTEDQKPVHEDQLIGVYQRRIPMVGDLAMFMQKPIGMVIFIGIPMLAFIIYDILRRQRYANIEKKKQRELEAEIARLKAMAQEREYYGYDEQDYSDYDYDEREYYGYNRRNYSDY